MKKPLFSPRTAGPAIGLLIVLAGIIPRTTLAGFDLQSSVPKTYELNYEAQPGETIKDTVIVKNTGETPLTLRMYLADSTLTRQGTYAVLGDKDPQRTIGVWGKSEMDTVTLDGNSQKTVSFTIHLPDKVTPGTYAGGIVASTTGRDTSGRKGSGVTVITRAALPIYLNVPGEVVHKFEWTEFSYKNDAQGAHTFTMKLKNVGNTVIIAQTSIEIYGDPDGINEQAVLNTQTQQSEGGGLTKEEIKRSTDRITENTMTTFDIPLFQDKEIAIPLTWTKKPLYGEYTAKATTTYWEMNIKNGIKSNPKILIRELKFSVTPWWLITPLIYAALAIAFLLLVLFFYRKNEKKHAEKYIVEENETITSIAEKKKTNWKKIARLNNLKSPYEVKKGQMLYIPVTKASHEKK